MATPLARLLHDLTHTDEVRAEFAADPEAFLMSHGYEHLDAADLREAFYVLADGSAPAKAVAYQRGGDVLSGDRQVDESIDEPDLSIDPGSGHGLSALAVGLAEAVGAVVATLRSSVDLLGDDPDDLDGAGDLGPLATPLGHAGAEDLDDPDLDDPDTGDPDNGDPDNGDPDEGAHPADVLQDSHALDVDADVHEVEVVTDDMLLTDGAGTDLDAPDLDVLDILDGLPGPEIDSVPISHGGSSVDDGWRSADGDGHSDGWDDVI